MVRGGVGVGVGRRGVFGGKGRKGDGWYVLGEGVGYRVGFVWWGELVVVEEGCSAFVLLRL